MATPSDSRSCGKRKPVLYIKTFGCQMNELDSEVVAGILADDGYELTDGPEGADIILFNTCCVRDHAEQRVWGNVGMLKKLKIKNSKLKIGILGCMAENYKDEIFRRLPHVDVVVGPNRIKDIAALIGRVRAGEGKVVATGSKLEELDDREVPRATGRVSAFVRIMKGCDNFCSFCIVPYVRGREQSRRPEDIEDEIRCLVARGVKEVTLLGQNVNSYGKNLSQPIDFIGLLERLNGIEGLERIRFVTSHPKDVGDGLGEAIAGLEKVCEHLHLPLQSGSDRMLRLMNRKHTIGDYKRLIERIRELVPEISLTTDIVVGHPGESEDDFKKTRQAMADIAFDNAFIFKYSPRPGTAGSLMADDVPQAVKEERNQILLRLQAQISLRKNGALVGTFQEVLVEAPSKSQMRPLKCQMTNERGSQNDGPRRRFRGRFRGETLGGVRPFLHVIQAQGLAPEEGSDPVSPLRGRTRTNKIVIFEGKRSYIGSLVKVKIKDARAHTLLGEAADGKRTEL